MAAVERAFRHRVEELKSGHHCAGGQHLDPQVADLEQDKRDWAGFDGFLRTQLAWNLSSFFIGEERVATQFSGLVRSYEDQAEEAFLTTQQVDEVRHAQFFNRFYADVGILEADTLEVSVATGS